MKMRGTGWTGRCRVVIVGVVFVACWGAMFGEAWAQNCGNTSTGLVPLSDLGTGTYQGYQGGLYPGGSNQIPSEHWAAAQAAIGQITPLKTDGTPHLSEGRIVYLSIGMSNWAQEFKKFVRLSNADPLKRTRVKVINGAMGGASSDNWADINSIVWDNVDAELTQRGLTNLQVQAVEAKLAKNAPLQPPTFPENAQNVQAEVEQTLRNVKTLYPNVRIVFLTSRTYGGYATTDLNPEPFAYVNGFSQKWAIETQINDPQNGPLRYAGPNPVASVVVWGPYLWADGLGSDGVVGGIPGRSDGLEWLCSDFRGDDGTHPSTQGALKVANMLLNDTHVNPLIAPWYRADGGAGAAVGASFEESSGDSCSGRCGALGLEAMAILGSVALMRRRRS